MSLPPENTADAPSQARYLFALFTGHEGLANVRALVGQTPRVVETNWLEFKSGATKPERIKTLWSKALGSFANSGGGVVIWGIYAARDSATSVDAVQEEQPVPDVERLVSRLKEYQPPATDPPIRGVEIVPLLLPGSTSEGFVVCLIPESDSKPHRSEFGDGDVKRFNLRIGDTTQECTVPILRQLFYPQYSPKIVATLEIRGRHEGRSIALITNQHQDATVFKLIFHNTGVVTLNDVFVYALCGDHVVYKDDVTSALVPVVTNRVTESLHPAMLFQLSLIIWKAAADLRREDLKVFVFARDMLPRQAVFSFEILLGTYARTQTVECSPYVGKPAINPQ